MNCTKITIDIVVASIVGVRRHTKSFTNAAQLFSATGRNYPTTATVSQRERDYGGGSGVNDSSTYTCMLRSKSEPWVLLRSDTDISSRTGLGTTRTFPVYGCDQRYSRRFSGQFELDNYHSLKPGVCTLSPLVHRADLQSSPG